MYSGPTRFRGVTAGALAEFKATAEAYPQRVSTGDATGFKAKPLEQTRGSIGYLLRMYQLLNGIQAMALEPGATIVEVGPGSGWTTEILAGLGFRLECLEPAEGMIAAARERVPSYLAAHGLEHLIRRVRWHQTTLEEAGLPDATADAVLFFESFHHLIDEHAAARNALRILRPGGVLCILGDANWIPGHPEQEALYQTEMDTFGTLESPFTHGYLEHVLAAAGFAQIQRYHSVNGFIPVEREGEPVRRFVLEAAETMNFFTARKG